MLYYLQVLGGTYQLGCLRARVSEIFVVDVSIDVNSVGEVFQKGECCELKEVY